MIVTNNLNQITALLKCINNNSQKVTMKYTTKYIMKYTMKYTVVATYYAIMA